jgi:hypothetical protein
VLARAGAARRLVGADGIARFELAEAVSGEHHHHLVSSLYSREVLAPGVPGRAVSRAAGG